MRALLFCAALLCGLPCFAASSCDVRVPTETQVVGDVRLAYQSIGRPTDPALLLVMGVGGQLIDWPDAVLTRLCQQGLRVIRFDNRDVGLSAWPQGAPEANLALGVLRYKLGLPVTAPYHLRDMAGDALQLMSSLRIERFHLLGASMGGMIAQHLAARHADRVKSLTLMMTTSGARHLPQPSLRIRRALLSRPRSSDPDVVAAHLQGVLTLIGSPAYPPDPGLMRNRLAATIRRAWHPAGTARQIMSVVADGDRSALLPRITAPTRVIHGAADPLVLVEAGHDLAAHISGAVADIVPGMGHDLPQQLLPRFAEGIADNARRAAPAAPAAPAAQA